MDYLYKIVFQGKRARLGLARYTAAGCRAIKALIVRRPPIYTFGPYSSQERIRYQPEQAYRVSVRKEGLRHKDRAIALSPT